MVVTDFRDDFNWPGQLSKGIQLQFVASADAIVLGV